MKSETPGAEDAEGIMRFEATIANAHRRVPVAQSPTRGSSFRRPDAVPSASSAFSALLN